MPCRSFWRSSGWPSDCVKKRFWMARLIWTNIVEYWKGKFDQFRFSRGFGRKIRNYCNFKLITVGNFYFNCSRTLSLSIFVTCLSGLFQCLLPQQQHYYYLMHSGLFRDKIITVGPLFSAKLLHEKHGGVFF